MSPNVTVVFPIYNAASNVERLVQSVVAQTDAASRPLCPPTIFIDNQSTDLTLERLKRALTQVGSPPWIRLIVNAENLGLSGSLNAAFAEVQTAYVLTCHADCFFEEPQFVHRMAGYLDASPKLAAITAQPRPSMALEQLPWVEKVNLAANLMDLFTDADSDDTALSDAELSTVGFAEGRCDIFRMQPLREVGFYDTRLKLAGEDQILAARLRERGFEIKKANRLHYRLSVSDSQNTIAKLFRHQQMFGRAHPYILAHGRHAMAGLNRASGGWNRTLRKWLRIQQLGATVIYTAAFLFVGFFGASNGAVVAAGLLGVLVLFKALLFGRTLRRLAFSPVEIVQFFALQPAFDICYAFGFVQGVKILMRRKPAQIS